MNRKIKNYFARMQKVTVAILCVVFFMATNCEKNNSASEYDVGRILGKWELIANGPSIDSMSERNDGIYWEFLPDGTVQYCIPKIYPPIGDISYHINIGTYTIDADFLVCKYYNIDDGTCYKEDRYKYKFSKTKLKLTKYPMYIPFSNGNIEEVYITNILIFKKIN